MIETPQETRTRFTMPIGEVAEAFGLPKSTLRNRMKSGMINLSARRFGLNTSPFLYDPVEVETAVPLYWAKVQASGQELVSSSELSTIDSEAFQVVSTVEPCAWLMRGATTVDQAEYCDEDAVADSAYCSHHSKIAL